MTLGADSTVLYVARAREDVNDLAAGDSLLAVVRTAGEEVGSTTTLPTCASIGGTDKGLALILLEDGRGARA